MSITRCLRCGDVALVRLPESLPDRQFLACPQCHRQYAQTATGPLTFRWGHPVSLALYPVLFDREPVARVGEVARHLVQHWGPADAGTALTEIQAELATPTQPVSQILGNAASEESCRAFLTALVARLRAELE